MGSEGRRLRLIVKIRPCDFLHNGCDIGTDKNLMSRSETELRVPEATCNAPRNPIEDGVCEGKCFGITETDIRAARQLVELRNSACNPSPRSLGNEFESHSLNLAHSDTKGFYAFRRKGKGVEVGCKRGMARRQGTEEMMDGFEERAEPRFRLLSDIMHSSPR